MSELTSQLRHVLGRHNDDAVPVVVLVQGLVERVAEHENDLAEAAGALMVPMPEPGTDMARVMKANALIRGERDGANKRTTELEGKIKRQREALSALNEAQARITSQLDLEAARRAAEMVQTLQHEPGRAAVELAVANRRIAELEALLADHGPEGRNVTNAQYVALRERLTKHEAAAAAARDVLRDLGGRSIPARLRHVQALRDAMMALEGDGDELA